MHRTRPATGYGPPSFWMLQGTKTRAFTAQSHHEPAYRFLWHYHPEWEIMFCRSGHGTRHVGDSVEKFGPGDLVMLPGKVPHTWFSSRNQVGPARCTAIHFLPELWGDGFWELPELRDFHALCQHARRGLQFTGEGSGEVGLRMEALAANPRPSLESFMELWRIFQMLTKLEARSLNAVKEGRGGVWQSAGIGELLEWLEIHIGEPITQHDAATRVRMSPASFSRWFKLNTGRVFTRYLNEIRIAKVCTGIVEGNLSITEAAYMAGYNNLSNFNRRFREVTGVTPRAFRSQLRAQPAKASA